MSKVFEIAFRLGGELTSSFKSAFNEADSTMKMLGAAAAAIGGTAVFANLAGQVVEMNDSLNKLSAQTGTYGAEMEALGDVAKEVFKQGHGESFDDVTAALMQVKNHMHNLDDGELQRVTGDAMMLANTFDAEVNEVTRAANNLMTNFGMDSTKAFDMMAAGAQNGLNFSNEMFDNLSEYSPLWADMGYSAEQMFGILEAGAQNGVYNLDYLNDVMKEFQIRATDGSKSTMEAVSALGPEVMSVWQAFSQGEASVADMTAIAVGELSKIDDKVKQNELGVALFGTKWEDLGGDVVLSMLSAGQAMTDFEGAMGKINEVRFDSVGAALKSIGRTLFVDLVMPIGDAVLPILSDLANYLSNNLEGALEKTKNVISAIAPVVIGLGVAFVTYQATLKAVALAKTAFNVVQAITPKLLYAQRTAMLAYTFAGGGLRGILVAMRSAMAALNLTMLANPIGITIAAIVGLTAAFVTAYKTSDRFRAVVDASFGAVQNVVVGTASFIANQAETMWDSVVTSAKSLPTKIAEAISSSSIGQTLSGLFSGNGIVDGLIDSIKAGFSSLPGIISMIAPTIASIGLAFLGVSGPVGILIGGVVSVIGFLYRLSQTNEGVAAGMGAAWESIKTAFAPVLDVLRDGVAEFVNGVGPQLAETMTVISESITALGPVFAELGSTVVQSATTTLPLLLQVFQTVFPLILNVVSTVLPIIIGVIASIVPIIMQLAQTIIPLILSVVQMVFPMILTIIQSVLPIVATLLTTVVTVILTLAQTVLPLVLSVIQMVFPIILSIIQTIIPVVVMVLQTLVAVINGVIVPAINGILAVVQFVFPFVQMLITNALAIVNGLIQAAMALLRGDWDGAWNAILTTATTIMDNIISFFSGINLFEVGKSIINGLIDGIASMGSAVIGAISGMIPEPIRGTASKLLGALPGFAKGGIVDSTTLAWVGEGGDTEAIIPWNNSQRSKDLWLQTGNALGMLNESGTMENIQHQIAMKTYASDNPAINSEQLSETISNNSNSSTTIQVNYNPQYNVQNADDLERVQQHAEQDKDDLEARLAQIARNERRVEF